MKMKKAIAGLCAGIVAISAMATAAVYAEDEVAASAGTTTEIDLTRPYLEWVYGAEYEMTGQYATRNLQTATPTAFRFLLGNLGTVTNANQLCIPGESWNKAQAKVTVGSGTAKASVTGTITGDATNGYVVTVPISWAQAANNTVNFDQFGTVNSHFNPNGGTPTATCDAAVANEGYFTYFKVAVQQAAKINTWKFYGTMTNTYGQQFVVGLTGKTDTTYYQNGTVAGYGFGSNQGDWLDHNAHGGLFAGNEIPFNAYTASGLDVNTFQSLVITANGSTQNVAPELPANFTQANAAKFVKTAVVETKEDKVFYFETSPSALLHMNANNEWMNVFRIMNDAIADNEGVTVTLVGKNAFNELIWNVNGNAIDWSLLPGSGNSVFTNNTVYASQSNGYYDPNNNWGSSLYIGGMVINNQLSRQFSDTDVFDWGTNTLTFDWDALTEGRILDASVNVNDYGFITGTTVDWAQIKITVPAQDAVDVAPDAGATVEEETTAAPAETVAVETAPAATNPPTGNAPIALAVIPVALAAAAIVAKKSK